MSHLFFSGVHSEEVNALLRAHCWVILRMTSVNIANLDSRFKSCLLYQLIADLCDVFCVLETRQGQSDKMNLLGVCPPGFLFFNNSSYSVLVVGKYFFLPCWSHSILPLNISFALFFPFLPHITNCLSATIQDSGSCSQVFHISYHSLRLNTEIFWPVLVVFVLRHMLDLSAYTLVWLLSRCCLWEGG